MLKSWRTTALGVLTFLGALGFQLKYMWDDDPSTLVDWNAVIAAAGVMLVGFTARDNQVTSEEAGVTPETTPEYKDQQG